MKIFFKTFGCRVNQIETESLREKIISAGHSLASSEEDADYIVVNTCSVTAKADSDCLSFLRRCSSRSRAGIAVSGCLATLSPKKIAAAAPRARIFGNSEKEDMAAFVCGRDMIRDFSSVTGFYGHSRAFVKIQDGCNLRCSYCLVNQARSRLMSKPLRAAVSEIKRLVDSGFSEIVLCGTRLGYYRCPETKADLAGLMSELFSLDRVFRIRFSSVESAELSDGLLKVLAGGGDKFCNYFHVPLQAGSDEVLRDMARPYDTALYRAKIEQIRSLFDNVGIYCDIIVGYPSETAEFFEKSERFVREINFSGLHVFSFSARANTRAALLKPLPPRVVAARSKEMRALDSGLRAVWAAGQTGKEIQALSFGNKDGFASALSSNFTELRLTEPRKAGLLLKAKIIKAEGCLCYAEPL